MGFEYTRPRGPIAPMYTSPGPAYNLPVLIGEKGHDPRSVHTKYPAFSFGVRHGHLKGSVGPGPSHFPNPKIYRDGRDGVPQYSLFSRLTDVSCLKTPGPGAYIPQIADCMVYHHHPSYSFSKRSQWGRIDKIPAANCYTLPSVLGPTVQSSKAQAPCYSLRRQLKTDKILERATQTPGPAKYSHGDINVVKNRAPLFSLTSRNLMPGDRSQKPGPGAHMADTSAVKPCNPAFSFGVKHSQYTTPLIVDLPAIECGPCD